MDSLKTDELLAQVKEIAAELKKRAERGEAKEAVGTIEELSSVMAVDNMKRRYVLIVSTDDVSFDVEWHNQDGGFGKGYKRRDGGTGIPEEELLNRNPTLWLCNLKMGKYDVMEL